LVADGVARAYGQARPFPVSYSALEAYQKIISYALRPWTIGTYNQIYSSVYGILGSIWRTGPQLAIVCTVGRVIDTAFKKIAEWTGLKKLADRIIGDAKAREKAAFDAIKGIVGEEKFTALMIRLSAESKTFIKLNPFKPAVSQDEAEAAAKIVMEYQKLQETLARCAQPEGFAAASKEFRERIGGCAGRLESIFGTKRISRFGPSFREFVERAESDELKMPDFAALQSLNESFGRVVTEIQTERVLA
jgi:hypothetical protein